MLPFQWLLPADRCVACGIRTRVGGVKGRCPGPLDERDMKSGGSGDLPASGPHATVHLSGPTWCCLCGDPGENRTRVSALRGRHPRPLDDGAMLESLVGIEPTYLGLQPSAITKMTRDS